MHNQALVTRLWLLRGLLRYLEEHRGLSTYIRENMPSDVTALKFTEEEIKLLEGFAAGASRAHTQEALDKIMADIKSHPGFYGIDAYIELPKAQP